LMEAVNVAEAGGDPKGINDSYHEVLAAEDTFAADVNWRQELRPRMYPKSQGRGIGTDDKLVELEKTIYAESEIHLTPAAE